ncbi:MAG TPA: hypothetical protein VGQ49_00615 [Bryobacteraceae bacterium]|jgi:hypothetical protein|nr:hypothetical protein [Bryobacteraceae bacterium]
MTEAQLKKMAAELQPVREEIDRRTRLALPGGDCTCPDDWEPSMPQCVYCKTFGQIKDAMEAAGELVWN